jgi:hypothetical protein
MRKEMPVIPVKKVVDPKRIIGKKWRAEEEERRKGSPTKKTTKQHFLFYLHFRLSKTNQKRLEIGTNHLEMKQVQFHAFYVHCT